jgi:D-serine deaminase-like pyridoxal phosphate-dependent protein
MDADYGRNLDPDGAPTKAFEPSLFVWATVMSRPADDRAIVDAGLNGARLRLGAALGVRRARRTYERVSNEHGRLGISGATNRLQIGGKIPTRPRPLRPDRQSLRPVRRHPGQPRRTALAD